MSDTSALVAIPGLIRAVRTSVEENAPALGVAGAHRVCLTSWLIYAEVSAEMLVEALPPADLARRPPQQVHAPLAENVEPCVPRRSGPDLRPSAGRPHP